MARNLRDSDIEGIQQAIRDGELEGARKSLQKISRLDIPRSLRVQLAGLARRAHAPSLGLRFLKDALQQHRASPATEAEITEYSILLALTGSHLESLQWLRTLPRPLEPEALLALCSIHVSRWNYRQTIPLLRQYLDTARANPYSLLVARLNLAAAFIFIEQWGLARHEIEEVICHPLLGHSDKLFVNVHCLLAQLSIAHRNWSQAEQSLQCAENALRDPSKKDSLLIRKWLAILALGKTPTNREAQAELRRIRIEASTTGRWETARHCDAYLAIFTENLQLGRKIHLGTPHPEFRDWLDRRLPGVDTEQSTVRWFPSGRSPKSSTLDLRHPERGIRGLGTKAGSLPHRLLITLASDFYRPFRLADLFEKLHPREIFFEQSSPLRVQFAIRDLRRIFNAARVPFSIETTARGFYRLASPLQAGVELNGLPTPLQTTSLRLSEIRQRVGASAFTTSHVAATLGISPRSARRLVAEAVRTGRVRRAKIQHRELLYFVA